MNGTRILIVISFLSAATMVSGQESPYPRMRPVPRRPAATLPDCDATLAAGTPCLWRIQPACQPPAGNAFPVRLFNATGEQQVAGTIYLVLPAGHEFRDINWKIALDVSNGPACPDIVENNVALSGFASLSIECAP